MARVERSIDVNVPVRIAYEKLNRFEEFPRFMKGVHSVHQLDESHLHWRAEKGGKEMEWDAEITENIPEKCIAWRNTSGPRSEGRVEFEALEHDRTRILLHMDADEAYLHHPDAIYGDAPQDEGDLARFKKMVESQLQPAAAHTGTGPAATLPGGARAGGATESYAQPESFSRSGTEGAGSHGSGASSASASSTGERKSAQASERVSRTVGQTPQQVWDDPMRIVRRMGEEMEQMLGRWIGPGGMRRGVLPLPRTSGEWTPPVDVEQHDGQLHICADLPGVHKEDVQIEIVRGQLLIEGERRGGLGRHRQAHRLAECNHGHFYRSIPLPEGADPDSAQATMHDGVLDITLQVAAEMNSARRLNIQG